MKSIEHATLIEVLHYDPETGKWVWREGLHKYRIRRVRVGEEAGSTTHGRRCITVLGGRYLAYRLAWFYMTGEWPPAQVDHVDRNPANDCWANLRLADNTHNNWNTGMRRNNTSGVKGVSWSAKDQGWYASIRHQGGRYRKFFKSFAHAHEWIDFVREELHGEFGRAA